MAVLDRNGVKLKKGQTVKVYQDSGITSAEVVKVFADNPTINEPGYWVDIERDGGVEGMMSYCMEVQ